MSAVVPGAVVRGSDGQIVGRVRDIYLVDRTGELAAITVAAGQLASRNVLIPAAAIADLEQRRPDAAADSEGPADGSAPAKGAAPEVGSAPAGGHAGADGSASDLEPAPVVEPAPSDGAHVQDTTVHLRVDSLTVRAGIAAPDTGHATPQQLHLAARELGIEEAAAG